MIRVSTANYGKCTRGATFVLTCCKSCTYNALKEDPHFLRALPLPEEFEMITVHIPIIIDLLG